MSCGSGSSRCCRSVSGGSGTRAASRCRTGTCCAASCFVLYTGIQREHLPQELGFGSGMTCWRRLRDWNEAGVRQRLHEVFIAELNAAARLDWSRCTVDSSHVRASKGAPHGPVAGQPGPARLEAPPDHRRPRHPARRHPHRRQPQRRHPAAAPDRRHSTGPRTRRTSTPTPGLSLRRPRLRPRHLPRPGPSPRHRSRHRPTRHPPRNRPGHLPLGRRAALNVSAPAGRDAQTSTRPSSNSPAAS